MEISHEKGAIVVRGKLELLARNFLGEDHEEQGRQVLDFWKTIFDIELELLV